MISKLILLLPLCVTGFLGDTGNRVLGQDEKASATADPAAALAGTACPRYIWMNHGTYYSYYAQRVSDCAPVNFDSTSNTLVTTGTCIDGIGCYPTIVGKNERGERIARADDPAGNGYGHGFPPNGEGRRRHVLQRGPNDRPWPGQSPQLTVAHVDDFEIDFLSPDGMTTLQAQVMVVKAKIKGSSGPMAIIGRAIEIIPRHESFRESPRAGTVGPVTKIPGRPYAFTFLYTPNGSDPAIQIEIITHHDTPGHTM